MATQAIMPKVQGRITGNSTITYTCPKTCCSFAIVNRGVSSLTFTINGITISVSAEQTFDDSFEDFNEVTITTDQTYEAIVRGW